MTTKPAETTFRLQAEKTEAIKTEVLARYARTGSVSKATSGLCNFKTPAEWCKSDPAFADAWRDAAQMYVDKLASEADRRAVEGFDHPVIHQGVITDTYKEYSDNLLMFRLKRLDPLYKDQNILLNQAQPIINIVVADTGCKASLEQAAGRFVESTQSAQLAPGNVIEVENEAK